MNTILRSTLSTFLVAAVLATPLARAQDDEDMPDGDVDIREQKKKPPPPKKDPPKKTEKAPPKKDPTKKPPVDDEDGILTGDPTPPPAPPSKKVEPPKPPPVAVDDEDEDMPGGDVDRVREPVAPRAPATVIDDEDEDLPPRAATPEPVVAAPQVPRKASTDDAEARLVVTPPRRTVEPEVPEVPEDGEGAPTGLIVGSAIGGALVLAAGAGVGGYFLFTSLQPTGATITVSPR